MWSAMSTPGVNRHGQVVLKINTICLVIELPIFISSYLYTPDKIQYKQQPLPKFWLSRVSEYSLLSEKAVKILLPFAKTFM